MYRSRTGVDELAFHCQTLSYTAQDGGEDRERGERERREEKGEREEIVFQSATLASQTCQNHTICLLFLV